MRARAAISLKTFPAVLSESDICGSFDGNSIVVVKVK
jgi:hypothetical protein